MLCKYCRRTFNFGGFYFIFWGHFYNTSIILLANVGRGMVIANEFSWIIAKDCEHMAAGKTLFVLHPRTLRKTSAGNHVKLISLSLLI